MELLTVLSTEVSPQCGCLQLYTSARSTFLKPKNNLLKDTHGNTHQNDLSQKKPTTLPQVINLCETKSQRTKRHSNTRQNDLCPKRS